MDWVRRLLLFLCFPVYGSTFTNIILIGMPNAGKSYIGNYLSRQLKIPCIDTDLWNRYHNTTKKTKRDWHSFREEECRIILEHLHMDTPKIISTGGGAIEHPRLFHYFLNRDPKKELIIHVIRPQNNSSSSPEANHKCLPATEEELWIKRGRWYFHLSDIDYWNEHQLN